MVLNPALAAAPTPIRTCGRLELASGFGGLPALLCRVGLVSGKRLLVPRIAVARTIFDVGDLVQKGGRELAIGAPVEVDHILNVAAGIAIDEETARRAGLCAAARVLGKLRPGGAEAHRDRKAIAQTHAHGAEITAAASAAVPLLIVERAEETILPALPTRIPILARSLVAPQAAKNLFEPFDRRPELRMGERAGQIGWAERLRAEPAGEARQFRANTHQTRRDNDEKA